MQVNARAIALAALLVALTGVLVYEWWQAAPTVASSPASAVSRGAGARPTAPASAVPGLRLDALQAAQTKAAAPAAERNPFVFQPKAPPPPTPAQLRQMAQAQAQAQAAPPVPVVPPPPPITLKFIGIVQAPDQKLAVLTDGATKDVFYGREGDIIDGRYRILRIGIESIEMAYVDGRGRQTLRLTGS